MSFILRDLTRANNINITIDPMEERSVDIASMLPYWELSDDLVEGVTALRAKTTEYLPKHEDESDALYKLRLQNTKFTNIYRDTVEGLASKPFEQETKFIAEGEGNTIPQDVEDFAEDVDGAGINLTMFASEMFFNGINSAIDWIFIDYPTVNNDPQRPLSIDDKNKANIRPYWTRVPAKNVFSVLTEFVGGKEVLTYIKVNEPPSPSNARNRFRIFDLDRKTGVVSWSLYEKQDKPDETGKTYYGRIKNGTLNIDVIPFVYFATGKRKGRTFRFLPPMRDSADLSKTLYQNESNLEFTKLLTAFPMLAANGIAPELEADGKSVKPIKVGPGRILYSRPGANGEAPGSWQYIEPSATSLKFLADEIKSTQQELRELGRQPLTAQSGNLTVISSAYAATKGRSAVAKWALGLKNTLENAMVITLKYESAEKTYDPQVHVHLEFDDFAQDDGWDAIKGMRDGGDLSAETQYEEAQRRGILSEDFDVERERKRLLAEGPRDDVDDGIDDSDKDLQDPPVKA
jgi:hypothetical protein